MHNRLRLMLPTFFLLWSHGRIQFSISFNVRIFSLFYYILVMIIFSSLQNQIMIFFKLISFFKLLTWVQKISLAINPSLLYFLASNVKIFSRFRWCRFCPYSSLSLTCEVLFYPITEHDTWVNKDLR